MSNFRILSKDEVKQARERWQDSVKTGEHLPQTTPETASEDNFVPTYPQGTQSPSVGLRGRNKKRGDEDNHGLPSNLKLVEDGTGDFDRQYYARNIGVIRDTMRYLKGTHTRDWDDDKAIDKYLQMMRYFEAGNTVTTGRVITNLIARSDEAKVKIGEGLQLFQDAPSPFWDGGTWRDKGQAIGDYTGSILTDPATWLTLGIGKVFTSAGAKAGATVAKKAALKQFQKVLKKELAKGATRKAAQEAAEAAKTKMLTEIVEELSKKSSVEIAKRTAATEAAKGIKKLTAKQTLKEAGITISADAAIAVGTEYFYQDAMVLSGLQEEKKLSRLAIAAIGTMAVGGLSYSLALGRGASGYKPSALLPNQNVKVGNVFDDVIKTMKEVPQKGSWKEKVARGKPLSQQDDAFWYGFLDAMAPALEREGYVWVRRTPEDKVSNWIADIIMEGSPQEADKFLSGFGKITGIKVDQMGQEGLERFANDFSKKMSSIGSIQGKASEIARRLNIGIDEVTTEHLIEDVLGVGGDEVGSWKWVNAISKKGGQLPDSVRHVQNNLIRLIVSNLSTTRLNLVGYGMATSMNTISDTALGILYGSKAVGLRLARNKNAKVVGQASKALLSMQYQKAKNLLDANTTLDQFMAYTLMRPRQMRELTAVLAGGIEDVGAAVKNVGLKEGDSLLGVNADLVVDRIQRWNFVQAQDIYTKSQEFLYHMDKGVRMTFGKTMPEIMNDPTNLRRIMATEQWGKIEAKAVWETQRAIFSASYKRTPGELGRLAAFIEDFRNIPFIGITIPFGRFFNNVLATSMDYSGLALMARISPFNYQGNRTVGELATRAAVAWTAIGAVAASEEEAIKAGLATFEHENKQGDIVDVKYTFPWSIIKGTGRLLAYKRMGKEPPKNELEEIGQILNVGKSIFDTVAGGGEVPPNVITNIGEFAIGQLTRDLSDATQNIIDVGLALWSEAGLENPKTQTKAIDLLIRPVVASVSAATRFLEPVNVMLHLINDTDFGVMDPKDGAKNFNEAFRYMDAFSLGGRTLTTSKVKKFDAASGQRLTQPDKFGTDRASYLTDTERVMNLVGEDHWRLNEFSDSAMANNVFAQYFHSVLEQKSKGLMESKKFREGELAYKQHMWSKIRTAARKAVTSAMKVKSRDTALYEKIISVNAAHSANKISKALSDVAGGRQLHELNLDQLTIVDEYLKGLPKSYDVR